MKINNKFCICFYVILFNFTCFAFAQQDMMIMEGSYKLKDGGKIPARCVEYGIADPGKKDVFRGAGSGLTITRTINGQHQTVPMEKAIQQGWIQVTGTESGNNIQIKVIGEGTFVLNAKGNNVISERQDTEAIDSLRLAALQPFNKYYQKLLEIFGQESGVVSQFLDETGDGAQLLYNKKVPETAIKDTILQDIEDFEEKITSLKDEPSVEYLSIMHGSLLDMAQLEAAGRFFKKSYPKDYRQIFRQDMIAYKLTLQKLRDSFDEEFDMALNFSKSVCELYREYGRDLKIAVAHAERKRLMVEFSLWDNVPGNEDLIALFNNRAFTQEQKSTISEITGYRFLSSVKDHFNDYLYINRECDERFCGFVLRTKDRYMAIKENEMKSMRGEIAELVKTHPNIIHSGVPLGEDLTQLLKQHDVQYIGNAILLLTSPPTTIIKPNFWIFASDNVDSVKQMFRCDVTAAKKIVEANKSIKIPNKIFIESPVEMLFAAMLLKSNAAPIFVFVDQQGKINFSKPIEAAALCSKGMGITINTRDSEGTFQLASPHLYEVLLKTLADLQTGDEDKAWNIIDFQKSLTKQYAQNYHRMTKGSKKVIGFATEGAFSIMLL